MLSANSLNSAKICKYSIQLYVCQDGRPLSTTGEIRTRQLSLTKSKLLINNEEDTCLVGLQNKAAVVSL